MVDPNGAMTTSDFATATSNFIKWFQNAPGTKLNPKIELADLRSEERGRGVVALQDIAEDEELFTIPLSLVLTAGNSSLPKEILEELRPHGRWPTLTVAIIHEYLRGEKSHWHPYFAVLPTETELDSLMFWTDDELSHLDGCAVVDKIGKKNAEQSWKETIVPIMLKHADLFPISEDTTNLKTEKLIQLAHMAGSLIMAYAFDVDRSDIDYLKGGEAEEEWAEDNDEEDEPLKAMVPFADMLNADADRNNARLVEEETDALTMVAIQDIKAGEEIFNDYGEKPRSDLLRMYGYITDNYQKYDVAEISYDDIAAVADKDTEEWKAFEKAREDGEWPDGYLISRAADEDARVTDVIDEALVETLKSLIPAEVIFTRNQSETALKDEPLSMTQILFLVNVLWERHSKIAGADDDDEVLEMLEEGNFDFVPIGVNPRRYRMALEVRMGEKEILTDTAAEICKADLARIKTILFEAGNKRKAENSDVADDQKQPKKS